MKSSAPLTHIMVALPCEAKPLVAHYRLKRRMSETSFPVYQGSGLSLTVSGIGKTAMAAALAYTQMVFGAGSDRVWLNIGVAGHSNHTIGDAFIATKITDADTGRRWYPPLVYHLPTPGDTLRTVSRPDPAYQEAVLYDMEASGFYETALRFSTSELVQCVKIISDNVQTPAEHVTPALVGELIGDRIDIVDALLPLLAALASSIETEPPRWLERFTEQWRFSAQQQIQLIRLLRRWSVIMPDQPPNFRELSRIRATTEVLKWLKHRLDAAPVML